MTRKLTVLLLLVLALTACAGDDSTTETAGEEADRLAAIDETLAYETEGGALAIAGEEAPNPALQTTTNQVLAERKVIRNASLVLEADDPEAAYQAVTAIVERAGGYVSDANVVTPSDEGEGDRVFMTVRIPASSMTATLEAIEVVGEVLDRSLGSQDVTEEYADIEAQVRNLQVLETELLALLRQVRESTEAEPSELLTVFNRISEVRGQIESLQGRQRLLDDLVGLATISVTIQEPPSEPPIVDEDGWNVGATAQRALRATVSALQAVGSGLIWLLLTVVPLMLLVAVPLWLVWRLVMRRRRASDAPAQSGPAQSGPAQSGPAQSGPAQSGPAHESAGASGVPAEETPPLPPPTPGA